MAGWGFSFITIISYNRRGSFQKKIGNGPNLSGPTSLTFKIFLMLILNKIIDYKIYNKN